MRLGTDQPFDSQRTTKKRKLFVAAGLLLLASGQAPAARAQQRDNNATNVSDLALQNLSRVAAPAAEIKTVLIKDAGLMVELKHWVAKDASDHGQIVNDSDLTNDTIFERLETDIQFRSVATALVQRYGYFLPKLNPDSELARENELLLQERAKLRAQRQEEDLTQARQRGTWNPQDVGSCDPQVDKDCNASQTRSLAPGGSRQEIQQGEPNSPNAPSGDRDQMLRAQLTQTAEDSGGMSSQFPMPGSYDSARSFNSNTLNVSASESLGSRTMGAGGPSGGSLAGKNSNAGGGDGLLAAYGLGTNLENGILPDASGTNGTGNSPSASLGTSSVVPMQPSNRRFPSVGLPQPPEMIRKASAYESIPSLYDMYVQAVTRPATPRRFGAEVFENGTRDSQLIPMDLPVGPDYVVGPGDGLSVDLWGGSIATSLSCRGSRGPSQPAGGGAHPR